MSNNPTPAASKSTSTKPSVFYTITAASVKVGEAFYPEYVIFQKTVEAVNSLHSLYKVGRKGAKGGPSTHAQQDLNRAMLVFACAGLDVLVKQLVKTKLSRLIENDKNVADKFKQYVKDGLKKDEKAMLNTVALALIDQNPRTMLLTEYIGTMTEDSLQSTEQLRRVSTAAGLDVSRIFTSEKQNRLRDAFTVRNQIIHEMDISVTDAKSKTTGHRTRRQRTSLQMQGHTEQILDLGQELFSAFRTRFTELKIDAEKAQAARH
jgi:hypothetical protein